MFYLFLDKGLKVYYLLESALFSPNIFVRQFRQAWVRNMNYIKILIQSQFSWGWSGGVMVLGKLPVPGRPTNLD